MSSSSLPLKPLSQLKYIRVFFIAFLAILTPVSVLANGAWENLLPLNPKAFALANSVSADYVGIDSLQYNPAALINLQPGFTTEFKLLGMPLVQVVRTTSQTLTPETSAINNLYFKGVTVRCDSSFKPFAGVDIRSSLTSNPGRDPLTGGVDPSVSGLNYNLPSDACFGPELVNPNGVFFDDPLDEPANDLDRSFPIPLLLPLYLPNIGYKASEDSRVAFAAQIFTNAPVPTIDLGGELVTDLGLRRLTFTPGVAFQVTDKLTIGGALRITKSHLDLGIGIGAQNQLFGFLNAVVQDLCTTNESRGNDSTVSSLFNCAELYREHQSRVENGEARDSGYWPFLPWEAAATAYLSGQSSTVYAWNLGVQWKPTSWLTWGATYRTKEDDQYEVDGRIYYSPGVVSIFQGLQTNPILGFVSGLLLDGSPSDRLSLEANVPFPKAFSSGISVQILEKTKLNIEYRKYYYSDWENWIIDVSSPDIGLVDLFLNDPLPIPAGGDDQSYYTFGIEHDWNQRLALRFGYEDRPFLDESGTVLPLYNIRILSIGTAYKLSHDKVIDVSLSSVLLDATKSLEKQSTDKFPLGFSGAGFENIQSDVHFLLFAAKYTHRF